MAPRQILIRCQVANSNGELSSRYVPAGEFGLWQHALSTRHNIEVVSARIGLWVTAEEFEKNGARYDRAGDSFGIENDGQDAEPDELKAVDRLDLSIYDEELGLCHLVRRFCLRREMTSLANRLSERLLQGLRVRAGALDVQQEVSAGYFVGSRPVKDLRRVARPLSALSLELGFPIREASEARSHA